ncbi:MAG: hypothetical protein K2K49_01535 [Duncaniella sp.]|nr:hypothetical protein [Duncaniella sp.]
MTKILLADLAGIGSGDTCDHNIVIGEKYLTSLSGARGRVEAINYNILAFIVRSRERYDYDIGLNVDRALCLSGLICLVTFKSGSDNGFTKLTFYKRNNAVLRHSRRIAGSSISHRYILLIDQNGGRERITDFEVDRSGIPCEINNLSCVTVVSLQSSADDHIRKAKFTRRAIACIARIEVNSESYRAKSVFNSCDIVGQMEIFIGILRSILIATDYCNILFELNVNISANSVNIGSKVASLSSSCVKLDFVEGEFAATRGQGKVNISIGIIAAVDSLLP